MSFDRAEQRAAAFGYLDAVDASTSHESTCPQCRSGCTCSAADALMTDEYRRAEQLRATDPDALRRYDRATWPTEG